MADPGPQQAPVNGHQDWAEEDYTWDPALLTASRSEYWGEDLTT